VLLPVARPCRYCCYCCWWVQTNFNRYYFRGIDPRHVPESVVQRILVLTATVGQSAVLETQWPVVVVVLAAATLVPPLFAADDCSCCLLPPPVVLLPAGGAGACCAMRGRGHPTPDRPSNYRAWAINPGKISDAGCFRLDLRRVRCDETLYRSCCSWDGPATSSCVRSVLALVGASEVRR